MNTVLDGQQWIFEDLTLGNIRSVITGNIYKDKRPSGSKKEDIVINSIAMDNSFLQDGVFNVNCYVPMLSVSINGITQYMPDTNRMAIIAKAVYKILNQLFRPKYNLVIESHKTFEEEAENANYINFRINLKTYN